MQTKAQGNSFSDPTSPHSNTKMKTSMKLRVLLLSLAASLLLSLSGCMNIYTRCPGTSTRIESCYQSTEQMFALSYVICFPQIISPGASDSFYWENIITVPCGIVCYLDTACEAVLDTAFLPFDYFLAR